MADEEYYLTAQYLVQIVSRAKELFAGSEPEEKRLLLNMTLQNLRLDRFSLSSQLFHHWLALHMRISSRG